MSRAEASVLRDAVIRDGADGAEMLACVREHGICVVPAFFPPAFVDPIREMCKARMAEAGDRNYEDGSYKRSDAYKGTAAACNERIYHADCFSEQAGTFRHHPVLKRVASDYYGSPYSVHLC